MTTRTARRAVRAVIAAAVAIYRPGFDGSDGEGASRMAAHLAGEAIEPEAPGGAGTLIGLYRDVRPLTAGCLRSDDRGDQPPPFEVHR